MQEPQETRVRSLHKEDPLGKGMATHSSILALEIPPVPGRRAAAAPHRPSPRSVPRHPRAAAGSGPHRSPGVAALGRRRAPRPRCPQPARPAPPRSALRAKQDAAVSRATGTRPGLPPPFPSYWTLDSRSRPLKANKVGEARQGKGRGRVSVARRPSEGLVSSLI